MQTLLTHALSLKIILLALSSHAYLSGWLTAILHFYSQLLFYYLQTQVCIRLL